MKIILNDEQINNANEQIECVKSQKCKNCFRFFCSLINKVIDFVLFIMIIDDDD